MKLIITLLCSLIAFSCGSPHQQLQGATPPQDVTSSGPPWESLESDERDAYALKCEAATSAVIKIKRWPLMPLPNNPDKQGNRYVKAVKETGTNIVSLVQYRVEDGKDIVELVVIMPDNKTSIMIMDYNIFRAFKTGAASPGDVNALSLATGEYFCVYNINQQ